MAHVGTLAQGASAQSVSQRTSGSAASVTPEAASLLLVLSAPVTLALALLAVIALARMSF